MMMVMLMMMERGDLVWSVEVSPGCPHGSVADDDDDGGTFCPELSMLRSPVRQIYCRNFQLLRVQVDPTWPRGGVNDDGGGNDDD